MRDQPPTGSILLAGCLHSATQMQWPGMLSTAASVNATRCKGVAQQLQIVGMATLIGCVFVAQFLSAQPDASPAQKTQASKAQASRQRPGKLRPKCSL